MEILQGLIRQTENKPPLSETELPLYLSSQEATLLVPQANFMILLLVKLLVIKNNSLTIAKGNCLGGC